MNKKCIICNLLLHGKQRKYCDKCKLEVHKQQNYNYYHKNKFEWLNPNGKYSIDSCTGLGYKVQMNQQKSEKSRIKMSCIKQGIKFENFDGFTNNKYCLKFNKFLKEKIRNQYNDCDYISGIHKDICNKGRSLDVHHVDYNKQQGCNSKKWKLIPLSSKNHSKTNTNRSFWNRLFIYSLEIDEWYYGGNIFD